MLRWKCANCSFQQSERPRSCPKCGLVQTFSWTHQKYEILEDYCHPLSLIMRNQSYEHYFIDACAGSGGVQSFKGNKIIEGSPLIMAKTKGWVESRIKDKTMEPSVRCVLIEYDNKTFKLLEEYTKPYSDFTKCIHGDANKKLDTVLNEISKAFTFVYVDPFGLGDPVIQYETIKRVLDRGFTEIFIHFCCDGIERSAGYLDKINHPNKTIRKRAQGIVETLNKYMKGTNWQEVWNKSPSWRRRTAMLELYEAGLKAHYKFIEHVEIPIMSKNPDYYLIFTTRNETGHKIMERIIRNKRRMGAVSLEKWIK